VSREAARAAGDQVQEDAAYRNELLELYVPVVEERPTWGWGYFPVMNGMASIDNGYLLTALTSGLYALGLWVAILLWTPIRLCGLGLKRPRGDLVALAAFGLTALYALFAICNMEGALMSNTQITHFFFLVTGWSVGLLQSNAGDKIAAEAAPESAQIRFRRVMA
jgi:O-antigen ligase